MPQQLTLNFPGGSVHFALPLPAVQKLESELQTLIEHLRVAGSQTGKKRPQPSMDYLFNDGVRVELFCNPNLWASPFAAKVLLTLKSEQVRLSVEVELSQLREDLQQYLQNVATP
ncbi:MAG: hypothetical protein H7Y22_18005 [Gemmatimonadaceae bacterium]|nr:hypothetical protein [Gloeobacterales cyanobacterium ES-bin-141]